MRSSSAASTCATAYSALEPRRVASRSSSQFSGLWLGRGATKTGDLSFICGEHGRPMVKESFGIWFRRACNAAGCPGSAHGLKGGRNAGGQNGATVRAPAVFGWRDMQCRVRTPDPPTPSASRARRQPSSKRTENENLFPPLAGR